MLVVQIVLSLAILSTMVIALVQASRLVPHRRDDLTARQVWLSGWRLYDKACFKPSGHPIQRRLFQLLAAVVGLMIVRAVLGVFFVP